MYNKFHRDPIDNICRNYQSAKQYIDSIMIVHGALEFSDNPCLRILFYKTLNIFFSDDKNTMGEKQFLFNFV